MKISPFWTVTLGCAWIFGGCIMGGNSDSDTVEKQPTYQSKIVSGHYIGDFEAITPGTQYEPEFILRTDGTFRYIVSGSNEALYLLDGDWKSTPDSLYEMNIRESYGEFGSFEIWEPVVNDSSTIRFITDSSFQRLEYLPFAHNGAGKIDWVTYRKISYPTVSQGIFEWKENLEDTVIAAQFQFGDPMHFVFETSRNKETNGRLTSEWMQDGTFLMLNNITFFSFDTNHVLVPTDSTTVTYSYRIKDISNSAITIWNGEAWDEFKKVE